MNRAIMFVICSLCSVVIMAQNSATYKNEAFLKRLYTDSSYVQQKRIMVREFAGALPGRWGIRVKGVKFRLATDQKVVALSFDACGHEYGTGYDSDLIDFLHAEKIPATLFVTGRWIDKHFETFKNLSCDTLFEIENHGFAHRPCSVDCSSEYDIEGTANASEAYDEIEANARKIEAITGSKPHFYRSATAYTDEASARMAAKMGTCIVSFDVLSGDADPAARDSVIALNVVSKIEPGAVVIMHFNHPQRATYKALKIIVPELRRQGYSFVKLDEFPLKGR